MIIKKVTNLFIACIIILAVFAVNGLISAWTGTGSVPPDDNALPPLNISSTAQTKSGGLYSDTDMRAPIFYDKDNTGYYADPSSNSWLYRLYSSDVRADILYDRNDTGYYVDPAGTSNFNIINLGGVSRSSWPGSDSSQTLQSVTNNGSVTSNALTLPIFYDYNNTGYYVDPAGTSKFSTIKLGRDTQSSWPGSSANCRWRAYISYPVYYGYCPDDEYLRGVREEAYSSNVWHGGTALYRNLYRPRFYYCCDI